jgi:glycerol-3-phosphate O-acyltransferase / dihydroxyacetone phosphate acyltransferase
MHVIRTEVHRRISWLVAEKSFRLKFLGLLAKGIGAVPVSSIMDKIKPGRGTIYLPDPVNQPTLLRGIGTRFDGPGFEPEGTIALPTINRTSHTATIAAIRGPEELILRKPFEAKDALCQLTGKTDIPEDGKSIGDSSDQNFSEFQGSKFKIAPHVDQTAVYKAVFAKLNSGGCVGIFPEGVSHDQPNVLPLKGTVAMVPFLIMPC